MAGKTRGRPTTKPGTPLSVFLNRLKEAVLAPKSDEFAYDVFVHYTNSPKNGYGNYVPRFNASKRTLGEYMSGQEPGIEFYRNVVEHRDINRFKQWLKSEFGAYGQTLALIANQYQKGATEENFAEHIAVILSRIIDAMRLGIDANIVIDYDPISEKETRSENYKAQYSNILLSESNFRCEICGKPLLGPAGNLDYFIMPIKRGDVSARADQLVPVCRNDFYLLEAKPDDERSKALTDAKFLFASEQQLKNIASMSDLDDRLGDLILALGQTGFTDPESIAEDVKIRMDPVKVDQKIGDEPELATVVKALVATSYDRVLKAYESLSSDPKYHGLSEMMSKAMSLAYEKIKAIPGVDKFTIFLKMVETMHEKTKKDTGLCMVLLCFYIQDCDFFDVIT